MMIHKAVTVVVGHWNARSDFLTNKKKNPKRGWFNSSDRRTGSGLNIFIQNFIPTCTVRGAGGLGDVREVQVSNSGRQGPRQCGRGYRRG